jgi:HlyD family secretion protein
MEKSVKEKTEAIATGNGVELSPIKQDISLDEKPDNEADVIVQTFDEAGYVAPKRKTWRIVVIALLAIALVAALAFWLLRPSRSAQSAAVRRSTIISSVETTGKVEAAESAKLAFKQSGRVERVLVEQGDFVEVGQVVAELDASTLQRQLDEAEVQLEISKLKLQQAKDGPLPADIARATADVDAAQARLDAVKRGPTAEDIAAAQSAVNVAQAKYDALKKGASTQELAAVQARLDNAKANRDVVASTAANNKEQARLTLEAAQKALAEGKGTQTQVDQAQSNYDTARSNETSQIAGADAQVREAQAALDKLKAGATAEELTSAEEGVAQARANLDKVKKGATPEEIAEAQSRLDSAQAALDRVKAGPTQTDLAILEQGVALAQIAVDGVKAQIADSQLLAPFSGTVLSINLQAGEIVGALQQVAVLADTGTLQVRGDIDEIDVGRVRPGQAVTVTLDAYPGVSMEGRIDSIAPGATQKQGSTVYAAIITFTPTDEVVPREGMAANIDITAQRKEGVLLVPNRALETVGQREYVTVQEGDKTRRVEVQTGLSNRTETEILSGLSEGQVVVLR